MLFVFKNAFLETADFIYIVGHLSLDVLHLVKAVLDTATRCDRVDDGDNSKDDGGDGRGERETVENLLRDSLCGEADDAGENKDGADYDAIYEV